MFIYYGNSGFLVIKSDEIGWIIFFDYDSEGCLINVMFLIGVVINLYGDMDKVIIVDIELFSWEEDVSIILNLFLIDFFYIMV